MCTSSPLRRTSRGRNNWRSERAGQSVCLGFTLVDVAVSLHVHDCALSLDLILRPCTEDSPTRLLGTCQCPGKPRESRRRRHCLLRLAISRQYLSSSVACPRHSLIGPKGRFLGYYVCVLMSPTRIWIFLIVSEEYCFVGMADWYPVYHKVLQDFYFLLFLDSLPFTDAISIIAPFYAVPSSFCICNL